jgi:sucrose-6-phosphate hydrolase SacC (GH32 family)
MKTILPIILLLAAPLAWAAGGVIGDFDSGSYGNWQATGTAFGTAPAQTNAKIFANGIGSGVASSFHKGDVVAKGTLVSDEFRVEFPYINFLINGARTRAEVLGVELLVKGKVVRSASATRERGSTGMEWRTWDVREFVGQAAVVRINDQSEHGWLAVDDIRQSDEAKTLPTDATVEWNETLRPQFHFTAPLGWMMDPTAPLYYKGTWHLFYIREYPGSNFLVWGHATSKNLVDWEHRPVAIRSEAGDSIFGGSALVDWENASGLGENGEPPLLIFHTMFPDKDRSRKSDQNLVYSVDEGATWRNYPGNPVLVTEDTRDRDPGVFWHKESRTAFMVLSLSKNDIAENRSSVEFGIYKSADFKQWELIQKIGPDARLLEHPDLYELPVNGDLSRKKWILTTATGNYITGSFDGKKFTPESEMERTRWGPHYYAAHAFNEAPNGRRVQMAWMDTHKPNWPNSFPGMPFNQQMACPRELTLRDTKDGLRVYRYPVREMEQLRVRTTTLPARNLAPGENALKGDWPELLDIELEFEVRDAKRVVFAVGPEEVVYDAVAKKLNAFTTSERKNPAPLAPVDGVVKLRLLIDRTSIEVFGNDGECDLAGVFYTTPDNRALSLTSVGGGIGIKKLTMHELRSIWRD